MREITFVDVVLGFLAAGFFVVLATEIRDWLGIHRPSRNPPAPRRHPPKARVDELGELIVCGAWPINPGDRVRILVSVPEYSVEIGHAATCEAVWPGDDVLYRFKLDGRTGRGSVITFHEDELWQLERLSR
jgi:hypothetical protein